MVDTVAALNGLVVDDLGVFNESEANLIKEIIKECEPEDLSELLMMMSESGFDDEKLFDLMEDMKIAIKDAINLVNRLR